MKTTKIYGPPGTGKTTKLIGMIKEDLKQYAPNEIALVAFTKKAQTEAVERMVEEGLVSDGKDLPFFRTLHSLCFQIAGVSKDNIISWEHNAELYKATGLRYSSPESEAGDIDPATAVIDHWGTARSMRLSPEDYILQLKSEDAARLDLKTFKEKVDEYQEFKAKNFLIDFHDVLELGLENIDDAYIPIKKLYIDEAQDLSALQWQIAGKLAENCEKVIIAGDDDQAIYQWNGASPDRFNSIPGDVVVLDQSYRVPRAIQQVSQAVLENIKGTRQEKTWKSRDEEGSVMQINNLHQLKLAQGTWMLLALTNKQLNVYEKEVIQHGLPYKKPGGKVEYHEHEDLVDIYIRVMKHNQPVTIKEWKRISRKRKDTDTIKEALKKFQDTITRDDLLDIYGWTGMNWYKHLGFKSAPARRIYERFKHNGIPKSGNIVISTIHQSKGGQAENVVVLKNISERLARELHSGEIRDEEHRKVYVAVTRAQKRLYLYDAGSPQVYPYRIGTK